MIARSRGRLAGQAIVERVLDSGAVVQVVEQDLERGRKAVLLSTGGLSPKIR